MERLGGVLRLDAVSYRLPDPLLVQVSFLEDRLGDLRKEMCGREEPRQVPDEALLQKMNALGRHARHSRGLLK